jgi:hypothetical protein
VAAHQLRPSANLRQVERGAHAANATRVEHCALGRGEQIGMRREVGDTLVEGDLAAAGNQAVEFSFRTLTELAEPAQIIVGAGFDQKNVQLVISNADPVPFSNASRRASAAARRNSPRRSWESSQSARSRSLHSC